MTSPGQINQGESNQVTCIIIYTKRTIESESFKMQVGFFGLRMQTFLRVVVLKYKLSNNMAYLVTRTGGELELPALLQESKVLF